MLRSLYSAISGLKNHQIKMDVIGNNISNVNTTGFKRSRVTFSTMLSQTMKGAGSPSANQGGTNPSQIGLGSLVSSIDQIMTPGSSQTTGKETDVMLQGSGFFVLSNSGQTVYSRAGAFSQDSNGNLIEPGTGAFVMGYMWGADDSTPADFSSLSRIKFALGESLPQLPEIKLADVPDAFPKDGWTSETTFSHSSLMGSYVDVSSFGLTAPESASFDSSTGTITFSSKAAADAAVTATSTTPLQILHQADVPVQTKPGSFPGNGWVDDQTYLATELKGATIPNIPAGATFDAATGTLTFDTVANADAASGNDITGVTYTPPTLTSFSFDQSGIITGVYSNGTASATHRIGQLAIASFANDAGLQNLGNSFFGASNNSGTAQIGAAGVDGRGTIVPSSVEMSNVDLSQEFTDMIVTQRGFQANSRVITVSDSLLQELIDLKRG